MALEGRAGPPALLMLKEWLELESSAELSLDGFGCYPWHLAAELRGGRGRRRNGDVIERVSAAVRAALFPPSRRDGEEEAALSRNFSRRLRVGFWKKRRGLREEVDRTAPSCSATTASGDGSSPAMSPRRRSWGRCQAGGVGLGVGRRQSHETKVVGRKTACHLHQEQEQKQRLSPVSVMDFLSQDEDDDGEDEDGNVDCGEDDGDNEIASPTFQRSLANIRRASQQLLETIRQSEQLAELDTSDVDDATTATEDISCHVAETDSESASVQELLDLLEASSPGSTHCFQKFLADFFYNPMPSYRGQESDGLDRGKSLLDTAKAWLHGQDCSLMSDPMTEMMEETNWLGRWRCLVEDEQNQLAVDLEGEIFWSLLSSKGVMDGGSSFDVRRAESSRQHIMAGAAALDPRRAEAASKHVRALNTQFASWVQLQLQNHPAELWEDGMKDYISHASEIMENFKDVVNWLRQNKAGTTAVSSPSPANDEKTTSPATADSKFMVQPGSHNGQKGPITAAGSPAFQSSSSPNMFSFSSNNKTPAFSGLFGDNKDMPGDSSKLTFQFGANNGFPTPTSPSIFSAPGSQSFSMPTPTLFSVNQQPILSGNQNAAEASGDADEDAEAEKPSSPSVKKAEEKGIVVVHEAKCKVYVKHDDATKGWKDIGVGQLSIRCKEDAEKASKESTPTVVIRNDVGKILLNALIYKGIKMNVQKNTVASIFHTSDPQSSESDSGTVVARPYLFRLKNEEAATKLSAAIKENAPSD